MHKTRPILSLGSSLSSEAGCRTLFRATALLALEVQPQPPSHLLELHLSSVPGISLPPSDLVVGSVDDSNRKYGYRS